jgi:hypothetical protein
MTECTLFYIESSGRHRHCQGQFLSQLGFALKHWEINTVEAGAAEDGEKRGGKVPEVTVSS